MRSSKIGVIILATFSILLLNFIWPVQADTECCSTCEDTTGSGQTCQVWTYAPDSSWCQGASVGDGFCWCPSGMRDGSYTCDNGRWTSVTATTISNQCCPSCFDSAGECKKCYIYTEAPDSTWCQGSSVGDGYCWCPTDVVSGNKVCESGLWTDWSGTEPEVDCSLILYGPNLQITDIYASWSNIFYVINNTGFGDANHSYSKLWVDGVEKVLDYVLELDSGSWSEEFFGYYNCSDGSHVVKICADDTGRIAEADETDNCLTKTIVCGQAPSTTTTLLFPTTTSTTTTTIPVTGKFSIGDRVEVTSYSLAVRSSPAGSLVGGQYSGAMGIVTGGPEVATLYGTPYNWWQIDYDQAPDGWSTEDWLERVSSPTTSVTTTIASGCSFNFNTYSCQGTCASGSCVEVAPETCECSGSTTTTTVLTTTTTTTTTIVPTDGGFDIVFVPIGISGSNYNAAVNRIYNDILEKSPFRECGNPPVTRHVIQPGECSETCSHGRICSECTVDAFNCAKTKGYGDIYDVVIGVVDPNDGIPDRGYFGCYASGIKSIAIIYTWSVLGPHELGHRFGLGHLDMSKNQDSACHIQFDCKDIPNSEDCNKDVRYIMDYCNPYDQYGPVGYAYMKNKMSSWMQGC